MIRGMAMARRDKPTEEQLQGFKYFRKLRPLFERLHAVGTARDRAGNRRLHMDQYGALVLLYMFNPVVSSLRAIQQASELKKVQRLLGCERTSLGSLSEAVDAARPAPNRVGSVPVSISGSQAPNRRKLHLSRTDAVLYHLFHASIRNLIDDPRPCSIIFSNPSVRVDAAS